MTASNKTLFLAFGALAFVAAPLAYRRWHERFRADRFAVTFFDVGQGDGALLEFPGGRTMLVDAGGGFGNQDVGRKDILRELLRKTILRLDVALISHSDQDHAYGFVGLLEELRIGELWVSAAEMKPPRRRLLEDLLRLAAVRQVPVRTLSQDSTFTWGGVEALLLPLASGPKPNDRSLVLRLKYADCGVLFTGDSEAAEEGELAARWARERAPPLTILKVSHHGSETSSTPVFLRATQPRWAVVSAGYGNRYGHPRWGAVERLRRVGATVLRTDFHGFVRFEISSRGAIRCTTGQGSCGTAQCAAPRKP